jgi:dihydrofolate reductase
MADLIFAMNVSLDGYVDHNGFSIGPDLFRHWTEQVGGLAGSIYGRRMYETMRVWDEDNADWTDDHRAFAEAWRRQPKWVASRTLTSVGPNATLVSDNLEAVVRDLKARLTGEIAVSGPALAASMTKLGLIDRYQLYLYPAAAGSGKPFFAGPVPRLRLVASDRMDADTMRLTYVPA